MTALSGRLGGVRPILRLVKQTILSIRRYIRYEKQISIRAARYAESRFNYRKYEKVSRAIADDGFAVIKSAVAPDVLDRIMAEFEIALEAGNVGPIPRNRHARGGTQYLTDEEILGGNNQIAAQADIAYAKDPLINCQSALPLIFSDTVVDIGHDFYECQPAITDVSVMRTYVNNLPPEGFGLFHCDYQSPRFIKFFYYLDDVDIDGGPFCYVRGSHRNKPKTWRSNNQMTMSEIESEYGRDAVCRLTAKKGDLIIANVTGFHCGMKPQERARTILMINTGVHPIDAPDTRILADAWRSQLSGKHLALADFLVPV